MRGQCDAGRGIQHLGRSGGGARRVPLEAQRSRWSAGTSRAAPSVLTRRRDRRDRGDRHGARRNSRSSPTAAPARPIASRPARSASRSPTRPRWRSRSTARSASPGRAIGSRSNATSELTRGMTVVDRLGVNSDAINGQVWGAAAGRERRRRHSVDLRLGQVQGYAEGGAGGLSGDGGGSRAWRPAAISSAQETSPYLLQHAHNPVHWRSWSAEALAEAKRRDCPILLSIGYAACHWCHVMAHESFEDAETARLMNELFVNIKVDREERPDIDHIYMTALHAHGPAGRLAADHVPRRPTASRCSAAPTGRPSRARGRPSFRQVLQSVDSAWRTRRDEMEQTRPDARRPSRRSFPN